MRRFVELPIKHDLDRIRSDIHDTEARIRATYGSLIRKREIETEAAKYKLEGGVPEADTGAAPGPRAVPAPPRVAGPSQRPTIQVRPQRAPAPPEDLALDALEVEEEPASPAPLSRVPRAPQAPARVAAPPAAGHGDDIFNLGEEIDLSGLEDPHAGTVDLGEDLLQELDEDAVASAPPKAGARATAAARPPVAQPPALRAVRPRGGEGPEEALDLEEPIELDEAWDPEAPPVSARSGSTQPIDIGVLAPGQDRTIELPVVATVGGRPLRLKLRVTVRLSR